MIEISELGTGRRKQVEVLARNPSHGRLAKDAAVFREEVRQCNATIAPRHTVGQHTIQKRLSVGPGYVIFCKTGQVDEPYPFAHGCAFVTHHLEYIIAPVTVILLAAIEGKPLGPLPAKGLSVHRALGF